MSKRLVDSRLVLGPSSFGSVELAGVVMIPAPPRERERNLLLPSRLLEKEACGDVYVRIAKGDSMQPTILDNDILVVDPLRVPRAGDIVSVVTPNGHAPRMIARLDAHSMLVKDNPRFRRWSQALAGFEVEGVVITRLHRQSRRKAENWAAIHRTLATLGANTTIDPKSVGYFTQKKLEMFTGAFDIPKSEMLNGRLPWGLFRARVREGHPHLGIVRGSWITLNPSMETKVGDCVFSVASGTLVAGVLQRDPVLVGGDPFAGWWLGSRAGCERVRIDKDSALVTSGAICLVESPNANRERRPAAKTPAIAAAASVEPL